MSVAASLVVVTIVALVSALLINNAKKNEAVAKQDAVARYRDSRDAIDTWLVHSSDALQFHPGTQSARMRLLQVHHLPPLVSLLEQSPMNIAM